MTLYIGATKVSGVISSSSGGNTGGNDGQYSDDSIIKWIEGKMTAADLSKSQLNQITEIKDYAFRDDQTPLSLELPQCTKVGLAAFNSSAIESVSLPACESIDSNAFNNCKQLKNVKIPQITLLDDNTFRDCSSLKNVEMPNVDTLRHSVFYNCSTLEEIHGPKLTRVDGEESFKYCGALKTVDFPKLKEIGTRMFQNCSFEILDLQEMFPAGLTRVGGWAFEFNYKLKRVWVPSTIEYMSCTFFNSNLDLVIFTDVPNAESTPQGWERSWCYHNEEYMWNDTPLTVIYGCTHENFLNGTLPDFPLTLKVEAPEGSKVKIIYLQIEKDGTEVKVMPNSKAKIIVEKEDYIPYTKEVKIEQTDLTVNISLDEMVAIPSTLNITSSNFYSEENQKLLQTFVDGSNFEIENDFIGAGNKVRHRDNETGYGYLAVKPTDLSELFITYEISCQENGDFGGVFLSETQYYPSWEEVVNNKAKVDGEFILRVSGDIYNRPVCKAILEANKTYYLNFFYVKNDWGNFNDDRIRFYGIEAQKAIVSNLDVLGQLLAGDREEIICDEITQINSQIFADDANLKTISLPNLTDVLYSSAFYNLKITELPSKKLRILESTCFSNCHDLTEADLSNVEDIRWGCFEWCSNLRKVWISDKCQRMSGNCFYGCDKLVIYTNLSEAPSGWEEGWDYLDWERTRSVTVVWNSTHEQYEQA